MKNTVKIVVACLFLGGVFLLSGCGCKQKGLHQFDLTLEVWGPLDYRDAFINSIAAYREIDPNIARVEYKVIPVDNYKKELTDALASGQGPDIFFIHNDWLPSFQDKIVEAPQIFPIINEQEFRNNFVDVAINDFINKGKVYAVPLSVNSLGLFYNKDLFNQAGIVSPPATWIEFIKDVKKLTKVDNFNKIIQSGAAIGTAYNINRSTDLLTLLMFQGKTKMIDDRGNISFDKSVTINNKENFPGENALKFYTQFADMKSSDYTWNSQLHYSLDAFAEGSVAMMFNYPWNIKTIQNKAPKLNFAVSSIPQIKGNLPVNYANYWGLAVAKNKIAQSNSAKVIISNATRVKEAWKFLTYLTTKPSGKFSLKNKKNSLGSSVKPNFDPAKDFLQKTGEPAARRDIIEDQKSDPWLGIFAEANLVAQSWRESDPEAIEGILAEAIDQVNKGQATAKEAIKVAAHRIQVLSN